MNKTVNINIGGLFFHIDEDAFQKLSRYFEAIKRSLTNASGTDEIMKDIEMRVAELLTDRQKSDKHVINIKDVDEVIKVMGQPEDYRIDDDGEEGASSNFSNSSPRKKLYRDKDKGSIGGVCTGLGYYFGFDATWIKIAFLATAFAGFGFGIIVYLILWIATPEAITTSEKLEMTGEPVTITTIEKKVRAEFDHVAHKIKNVDYDKMGNQVKHNAEKAGNQLGDFIIKILEVFAKILGASLLMFSAFALLGIIIAAIVLLCSSSLPTNTLLNHFKTPIGLETPLWLQAILFFFAFGIPLFFLLLLGLKLLVTNLKSIGNIAKYSLLAVWIIAVGVLISLGINEMTQLAFEGKTVKKETFMLHAKDTLHIKFATYDYISKNFDEREDFIFTQDSAKHEVIYSNNINLKLKATDRTEPYIQIERLANGSSFNEANTRAEKIKYSYKIVGNQLMLDNFLLTEVSNKFRNQHVDVYLYLPVGTLFKMDDNVDKFEDSDNEYFNRHFSSDEYIYRVDSYKVKCLNCPADENEYNDVELSTPEIPVVNDTINVPAPVAPVAPTKPSRLTQDKNGIITKTKTSW